MLSGIVSAKYVIDRASSLAVGYVDKPENIVNLLRQQESSATDQVMLKVRFAEVSRSAMQELGASFFTGPNGKGDWIGRGTTQQFPAPTFDNDKGSRLQRLSQPVRVQHRRAARRGRSRAQGHGVCSRASPSRT